MRNLSPLGAIHSPIDVDRDVKAYLCDFNALGLPDQSPFDILKQPKATPRTPKEKKPSKTQREMVMASLQDLPGQSRFNTDIPSRAESDRTISIRMGVV